MENSEKNFANLAGHELIAKWRAGSEQAATILMDRYRVRMIALVASRLSRGQRGAIDPEDVVQSAMGSFFRSSRPTSQSRLQIESTQSVWNLLAMFARRKLSRALERATAAKRGGDWNRTAVNQNELLEFTREKPESQVVDELVADLNATLAPDQVELLKLLLAGNTQNEIAEKLSMDERTVRRRVTTLRNLLTPHLFEAKISDQDDAKLLPSELSLPRIRYGQFVLGKMIGSGGFGKVYQAHMQGSDAVVAVKFMHRHLWTDLRAKRFFLQEIDHASRIGHRGIIKYLGWGESPHGGPYILSEFIEGQPLSHCRYLGDVEVIRILRQVCEAVGVAHSSGIVHGDLTPNNILISSDGLAIITDFGLSTCMQPIEASLDVGSVERSSGGTLGYAAPEQISSAFGSIGPWTDIYAIGALAYFCLTGTAPHAKEDATMSLSSTIADEDETLPIIVPLTPASLILSRIAKLALRKAVADRPHNVESLIAELSG